MGYHKCLKQSESYSTGNNECEMLQNLNRVGMTELKIELIDTITHWWQNYLEKFKTSEANL